MSAVIFDMDGVIFDSEKAVLGVWKGIAAEWGLKEIERVFLRCVGTTKTRTREILREEYPELDFEHFDQTVRERFLARYGGGRLPLKPGTREVLAALQGSGTALALASSTRTVTVRRELEEAGLLDLFSVVVGGDAVTRSKPDPEIFLEAAKRLGEEPKDCFVIEDSFNGVRAAYAGGFRPVMVPDLLPPDREMREKAERIVNDLWEAETYLRDKDKEQEERV